MGDRSRDRGTRVFVGGIGESVRKEDLEEEFEKFGKLNSVWVASNPPGFAFVEFNSRRDAETACDDMNDTVFMGLKLRVEIAQERPSRRGGPRGGGGGYRGGGGGYRGGGGGHRGGSGGYRGGGGGYRERSRDNAGGGSSYGGSRGGSRGGRSRFDRRDGSSGFGGRDFDRRSESFSRGGYRGARSRRGGGGRFDDRNRSRSPSYSPIRD